MIFKQILEIHSAIGAMNASQAIAAYQAVRFFVRDWDIHDPRRMQAGKITDALVARMLAIIAQTPPELRVGIAVSFEQAVEVTVYHGKFYEALKRTMALERFYA